MYHTMSHIDVYVYQMSMYHISRSLSIITCLSLTHLSTYHTRLSIIRAYLRSVKYQPVLNAKRDPQYVKRDLLHVKMDLVTVAYPRAAVRGFRPDISIYHYQKRPSVILDDKRDLLYTKRDLLTIDHSIPEGSRERL